MAWNLILPSVGVVAFWIVLSGRREMKKRDILGALAVTFVAGAIGGFYATASIPDDKKVLGILLAMASAALLVLGSVILRNLWVEPEKASVPNDKSNLPFRISLLNLCEIAGVDVTAKDSRDMNVSGDFGRDLTQACIDGRVTLYGRKVDRNMTPDIALALSPLVMVPAKHLHTDAINVFARKNLYTKTNFYHRNLPYYCDLHVDRMQADNWLIDRLNLRS